MIIETDDWLTGGEAARLLDVLHSRVMAMAKKDGSLDFVQPWDHVTLVRRADVEAWMAGERQERIGPPQAKRWLLKRAQSASVNEMDINDVRDMLRDYIEDARPRWDNARKDLWALNMASTLWANDRQPA